MQEAATKPRPQPHPIARSAPVAAKGPAGAALRKTEPKKTGGEAPSGKREEEKGGIDARTLMVVQRDGTLSPNENIYVTRSGKNGLVPFFKIN